MSKTSKPALDLSAPLTRLEGIGPARQRTLARAGLNTVRDLLLFMPRRAERWPEPTPLAAAQDLDVGAEVVVRAHVARWRFSRMGKRSLLRVELEQEGATIDLLFFNQAWLRERFRKGEEVACLARRVDAKGAALVCLRLESETSPFPPAGTWSPAYAGLDGFSAERLGALCRSAADQWAHELDDALPADFLARMDLPSLPDAAQMLHRPTDGATFERARARVALEPLCVLQAKLIARNGQREDGAHAHEPVGEREHAAIVERLPFRLTEGQERITQELRRDLTAGVPMRRLLQGDVGSGKTVLALYACMIVAGRGGQAALMAPTELLAEQHFAAWRELLSAAGLEAVLITGSLKGRERREAVEALSCGRVQLAFGTHALFSADIEFARLELAVVDEQHRFGVDQRRKLVLKGESVHVLTMTATPIPRSLALTVYGDLDVSILRSRPPGRGEITTRWLRGQRRRQLPALLQQRLDAGEQVYWVVPRIEDGDDTGATGARERHEKLTRHALAAHGLEWVHGAMPVQERRERLARFRNGDVSLLVATTVVEVGVDVPRATVMVIECAERLGLSQLHQLRGRVGRGADASFCFLLGKDVAAERLQFLEQCHDGFEIAEADLRLRGMGDLAGVRQAGANTEGFDDPDRDLARLEAARELLADRPDLVARYLAMA